jgi:hypothetical protein
MKMPQSGYARDPRKCVRFRVKVTRQTQFWGAIGRKPVPTFADRAPDDGGMPRELNNEY